MPLVILTFDQQELVHVSFLLIIAYASPPIVFFLITVIALVVFFLELTVSTFLAEVYDFIPLFVVQLIKLLSFLDLTFFGLFKLFFLK